MALDDIGLFFRKRPCRMQMAGWEVLEREVLEVKVQVKVQIQFLVTFLRRPSLSSLFIP